MSWAAPYVALIEDCEKRESKLSDWERNFVDSLRRQIEQARAPTPKQVDTLDALWEKVTRNG